MSIESRARRVHKQLPWRKYQALRDALAPLRPTEDPDFVGSALTKDVPPMPLVGLIAWMRHFMENSGDLLKPFLSSMTDEQLARLYTLEHVGSWKSDDPPALHRMFARERTQLGHHREVLIARVANARLDGLEKGLAVLANLGIEPDAPWHESIPIDPTPPHNYAVEPRWLRIKEPGRATLRQIFDLIDETRAGGGAVLFGCEDPDMGPYSKCVCVKESAADYWCKRGYRRLSALEEVAAKPAIDDYTETWKHSD